VASLKKERFSPAKELGSSNTDFDHFISFNLCDAECVAEPWKIEQQKHETMLLDVTALKSKC